MRELFTSGRIADVALVLLAIEGALLCALRQRPARVRAAMLTGLLPGVFLLLALRAALAGDEWYRLAAFMAAALVAHLADLWRRWRDVTA